MLKTLTKTALAATGLMLAATGTYSKDITKHFDNYVYYGDAHSNPWALPPPRGRLPSGSII